MGNNYRYPAEIIESVAENIELVVKDHAGDMQKIQKKYISERTERYEDSSNL